LPWTEIDAKLAELLEVARDVEFERDTLRLRVDARAASASSSKDEGGANGWTVDHVAAVQKALAVAEADYPDDDRRWIVAVLLNSGEHQGERERHEESMARGLSLQADFIAGVRAALGDHGAEFTDRQIWQEALRVGPIEPADLATHLLASVPSQQEGGEDV